MSSSEPVIVWFRDDLRIADNPALTAAVATGSPVIAAYVLDEVSPGVRPLGGARKWWLHGSLAALSTALGRHGVPLVLRRGAGDETLLRLVEETGAAGVLWNRRYDAAGQAVDRRLKERLKTAGRRAESHQSNLLHEPWTVAKGDGEPFRVFTPFWKAANAGAAPRDPLPAPARLVGWAGEIRSDRLDDWGLLPTKPDWAGGLRAAWTPGEAAAAVALHAFVDGPLARYADERDRPDLASTSRLSPHLANGEISPFQIRRAALDAVAAGKAGQRALTKFLAEIGWREFSYHLLAQCPDLATRNFQPRFDHFPWSPDPGLLAAWRKGRTGIPLVDAGMRQLWETGWMHNRVRMVVASFLVKHLLQDWRAGEAWFWDTLVDADLANNAASWQWVAGTGADAAPYFRVFNPVLQGEKFDPDGAYVRRFVPELAKLASIMVQKPWDAPIPILAKAGIRLGIDYPAPVVDLASARDRALAAFDTLKHRPDAA